MSYLDFTLKDIEILFFVKITSGSIPCTSIPEKSLKLLLMFKATTQGKILFLKPQVVVLNIEPNNQIHFLWLIISRRFLSIASHLLTPFGI